MASNLARLGVTFGLFLLLCTGLYTDENGVLVTVAKSIVVYVGTCAFFAVTLSAIEAMRVPKMTKEDRQRSRGGPGGVINWRDLGGMQAGNKKVKTGRVFRTGAMPRARNCPAIGRLKLVVDLRMPEEIKQAPDAEIVSENFKQFSFNMSPYQTRGAKVGHPDLNFVRLTRTLLTDPEKFVYVMGSETMDECMDIWTEEKGAAPFGEVLKEICNVENHPVAFHCRQGQDRAGLISALYLLLLGVDREKVVHDYLLSNNLTNGKVFVLTSLVRFFWLLQGFLELALELNSKYLKFFRVHERVVNNMFEKLDKKYGHLEPHSKFWSEFIGISEKEIYALREQHLEG